MPSTVERSTFSGGPGVFRRTADRCAAADAPSTIESRSPDRPPASGQLIRPLTLKASWTCRRAFLAPRAASTLMLGSVVAQRPPRPCVPGTSVVWIRRSWPIAGHADPALDDDAGERQRAALAPGSVAAPSSAEPGRGRSCSSGRWPSTASIVEPASSGEHDRRRGQGVGAAVDDRDDGVARRSRPGRPATRQGVGDRVTTAPLPRRRSGAGRPVARRASSAARTGRRRGRAGKP